MCMSNLVEKDRVSENEGMMQKISSRVLGRRICEAIHSASTIFWWTYGSQTSTRIFAEKRQQDHAECFTASRCLTRWITCQTANTLVSSSFIFLMHTSFLVSLSVSTKTESHVSVIASLLRTLSNTLFCGLLERLERTPATPLSV